VIKLIKLTNNYLKIKNVCCLWDIRVLPGTLITHANDVTTVISIKAGCQKNWLHSNNSFMYLAPSHNVNERVGRLVSWYKLPGSGTVGSNYVAYIFVFLGSYYRKLLNVQINPLRSNPRHFATENKSFQYRIKIFSWSYLAGGPRSIVTGAQSRCWLPWLPSLIQSWDTH